MVAEQVSAIKELYEKAHATLDTQHPLTIPSYRSITLAEAKRLINSIVGALDL